MNIGYERIEPPPSYPSGTNNASLSKYNWESQARDVVNFKLKLKASLRITQKGRCCYCRRLLGDPITTDLEHYIEKSVHPWLRFEIRNIALACHTCNNKKNSSFLKLCGRLNREAKKNAGNPAKRLRSPTLVKHLDNAAPIPTDPKAYRWVHPHFEDFSKHIKLAKGWVFSWRSSKGARTIRGLQLNALAQIERRALSERMSSRTGLLSLSIGALSELNSADAKVVCSEVANQIRLRLAAK